MNFRSFRVWALGAVVLASSMGVALFSRGPSASEHVGLDQGFDPFSNFCQIEIRTPGVSGITSERCSILVGPNSTREQCEAECEKLRKDLDGNKMCVVDDDLAHPCSGV